MIDLKKLESLSEDIFRTNGITKHRFKYIPGKNATLELAIMKQDGSMDIDTCEKVSQLVSEICDQIDDSESNYYLDVCSFGAERVLESREEVSNEVGNYIHVELFNPMAGFSEIEGTLNQFVDDQLSVIYFVKGVKKTAVIAYDNIKLIRLAVKL